MARKRSLNGVEVVISTKLPDISRPQFHLLPLGALTWRHLVAKVGTSNQDRTISLKAAVHSCINKQTNKCPIQRTFSGVGCPFWNASSPEGPLKLWDLFTQYHVPEDLNHLNVTTAQETLLKKFMKPACSDEELQKLIETRDTVNTVPPIGVNKRTKY
jgi:hypothetical protein